MKLPKISLAHSKKRNKYFLFKVCDTFLQATSPVAPPLSIKQIYFLSTLGKGRSRGKFETLIPLAPWVRLCKLSSLMFFHQAFSCLAPCCFPDISELIGVEYFIIDISLSESRRGRSLGRREEKGTDYRELQKGTDTTNSIFDLFFSVSLLKPASGSRFDAIPSHTPKNQSATSQGEFLQDHSASACKRWHRQGQKTMGTQAAQTQPDRSGPGPLQEASQQLPKP